MSELLYNYLYYVIKNDDKMTKAYHKAINKVGIDDYTLRVLLQDKEMRATYYVMKYYLNNNFTLDMLHDRLYDLFKSFKDGVIWFNNNDDKIKNFIKEIEVKQ